MGPDRVGEGNPVAAISLAGVPAQCLEREAQVAVAVVLVRRLVLAGEAAEPRQRASKPVVQDVAVFEFPLRGRPRGAERPQGLAGHSLEVEGDPLGLGLAEVAAQRSLLAERSAANPGHLLPGGIDAGGVLAGTVAAPQAVGRVAEGVGPVEFRVQPGHVDQARVVRPHRPARVHHLRRRIGRRGEPGRHLAAGDQDLGAQVPAALRVPGGLGEPLAAAGVLHQVVECRELVPAERTPGTADRAADALAVRVPDPGVAGERVERRRPAGSRPAAARVVGIGGERPVPVEEADRAAPREAERTDRVAPAGGERPAGDQADLVVAVRTVDHAVLAFEREAVEVAAGDHVHHAGDRVRAVGRRAAVAQELDPHHGDHRQDVRVDHELRLVGNRAWRPRQAVAVQEDEGAARAEAAQVQARAVRAGAHAELLGSEIRAETDREIPDEIEHAGRAFRLQVVARQDGDRLRRVFGSAGNPRPGDRDRVAEGLDLVVVVLVVVVGPGRLAVVVLVGRRRARLLSHPGRRTEKDEHRRQTQRTRGRRHGRGAYPANPGTIPGRCPTLGSISMATWRGSR